MKVAATAVFAVWAGYGANGWCQAPASADASAPVPAEQTGALATPQQHVIDVPAPDPALKDHTEILLKAAAQCEGKPGCILRLSPGTYYISPSANMQPEGGLKFLKLRGLTIDGRGATLMMTTKMTPLYFKDCEGVTVRDLTIDSEHPYFAQGTITAGSENSLDIEIDPDFPLPEDTKIQALMDYDPVTRLPLANLDIFGTAITKRVQTDANHIHLEFRRSGNPRQREHHAKWLPASKGKLVLLRTEIHGHYGLTFTRCTNVVMENIRIYSSAGMAIHAAMCENVSSTGVQVRIRPNSRRLMSSAIDCQYYTFCKGKISIHDGYYEGMGDDGCNVTAKYRNVAKLIDERTFDAALTTKIGWIGAIPVPGEKITFQKRKDFAKIGTWTVKSCSFDAPAKQFHMTVEEPLTGVALDDLWYSEAYLPTVEIRNSTFRGMRARGILLSTHGVTIENCTIESPGYVGILLKGGLRHGGEGPVPSDVTIRGCTFIGCGGAAIYAYPSAMKMPAGTLREIRIENNTFRENPSLAAQRFKGDNPLRMHWASAIDLLSVSTASVINNTFEGYSVPMYLNNCADIKVEGNRSETAANILLEKDSTREIKIGGNPNITASEAPEKTLPDLEYMNDFR